MNPNDHELEQELAALIPAPPSESVSAEIEARLSGKAAGVASTLTKLAAAMILLGAALVVFVVTRPENPTVEASASPPPLDKVAASEMPGVLAPVHSATYLVNTYDDGLIMVDETVPAKKERLLLVNHTVWQAPDQQISVQVFEPWEQTIINPITLH